MKRVISLALCLILVLSMSTVAFADATTYTLTINNTADGHTYEAYQIFSGTLETVAGTGNQVLANIEWGASIKDGPALLTDILALATSVDNTSPLKKLLGSTDAASLAEAIADNITPDSASLDMLAEVIGKCHEELDAGGNPVKVYTHLNAPIKTSTDALGVSTYDGTKYTISGLNPGYYLIKDAEESLDGQYDSYTKFILRVIKNETVSPKSGVPSVDKEINDQLGGSYVESKDFDINDPVYYKWTGHLPSNLSDYESYHYKFIDTLPTGLKFKRFEQVYLVDKDNALVHTFMDLHDGITTNDTMPAGIVPGVSGQSVTLLIQDLITLYPNILPTQKIIVKYSAYVTREALMGQAMSNTVKVEFDNDPNHSGDGHYGETPEDEAHAFTFGINVEKYDADNHATKLPGAQFILYYTKTEHEHNVNYYAKVLTKAAIEGGITVNGVPATMADRGVVYEWTTDRSQASTLTTNESGAIQLRGLDAGIYYLQETEAPAGYNLMETPVKVEIAPTYNKEGDLTAVEYKVDDVLQTSNTVGVRNSSGSTLPVTGGVGTTLFYIFGAVMVLGAAVLLITKKRVGAED